MKEKKYVAKKIENFKAEIPVEEYILSPLPTIKLY